MLSVLLAAVAVGLGWENGWVKEWRDSVDGLEVRETRSAAAGGLEKVVVRWTWKGDRPLEQVTLAVREKVRGRPERLKPFLPGILMYGNPSNAGRIDGRVPVYAGKSGEFAIFEDHRFPMPFVLMENADTGDFTAVHTVPSPVRGAKREDLWWSAGVETTDDGADIVLLSGPVGYNRRRSVVKALQGKAMDYDETYLTLKPGDVIEKTYYLQRGRADKSRFGFEQAISAALDLFRPFDAERFPKTEEIVRLKRKFALSRWIEDKDRGIAGINMYDHAFRREIVLGWAGACEAPGWALPVLGLDTEDDAKAQRMLDFIAREFKPTIAASNGLFKVRYDVVRGAAVTSSPRQYSDPISCGQSLYNVMKAIRYARRHRDRLDPTKWEDFAFAAAENAANHYLSPSAPPLVNTGVAFFVPALVAGYDLTGNEKWKRAAEKIAAEVADRYFGYDGIYWGGTLDANCEDKEGSIAAFLAFHALLKDAIRRGDAAAEKRWARLAEHAMMMSLSYTVVWDIPMPPGRLADNAFKSTGWTGVSAQNQHLDVFGVLITPEVKWMGRYLKDPRLEQLAEVMFRSCGQLVDECGSQGEQIQQTNFAQHGDMSDVTKLRGGYSESWTVFWITAHFLNAAATFKEMDEEPVAAPVKVIFDTDMLTDFDDVGALACLHALADRGECEILATVSCTRGNASVAAIEVINGYYGRSSIPVGCTREIGVIGDFASTNGVKKSSAQIAEIMRNGRSGKKMGWGDGGHYKYRKLAEDYPQWVRHADSDDAPDANLVYRRALASAPDHSVVICSVGFLTNLRRLLETKPDSISPLGGRELVAKKVKKWIAMACSYPSGREYNSMMDPESSRIALAEWPTPVVISDWQYGADVFAGRAIAEMKGPRNPVKDVFAGNIPSRAGIARDPALAQRNCFGLGGRSAWDETAVLAAVRGEESYFNVHRGEYRMVGNVGENVWSPDESHGRHLRITEKLNKVEVGRIIDELICEKAK